MKNLMKKIRKSNKGFTLVELIIVVAIIAVLSAVVAPQYIKYVERSRQGVDASTLEEVRHAAEVEAAINPSAGTVTVAADGTVGGTFANKAQVIEIVGTKVELKSKAAKLSTYQVDIDANGVAKWADASKTLVGKLQAGTAPTAAGNNQQNNNQQNNNQQG